MLSITHYYHPYPKYYIIKYSLYQQTKKSKRLRVKKFSSPFKVWGFTDMVQTGINFVNGVAVQKKKVLSVSNTYQSIYE